MGDSWAPDRSRVERLARGQLSMTPGTALGRVSQASPVRNTSRQEDGSGVVIEVPFSYYGEPQAGEESPPYFNRSPGAEMGTLIANTASTTTGSSVFNVLVNGSTVATLTVPPGVRQSAEDVVDNVTLEYGDQITVKAVSVGSGLFGLVIQVLIEE